MSVSFYRPHWTRSSTGSTGSSTPSSHISSSGSSSSSFFRPFKSRSSYSSSSSSNDYHPSSRYSSSSSSHDYLPSSSYSASFSSGYDRPSYGIKPSSGSSGYRSSYEKPSHDQKSSGSYSSSFSSSYENPSSASRMSRYPSPWKNYSSSETGKSYSSSTHYTSPVGSSSIPKASSYSSNHTSYTPSSKSSPSSSKTNRNRRWHTIGGYDASLPDRQPLSERRSQSSKTSYTNDNVNSLNEYDTDRKARFSSYTSGHSNLPKAYSFKDVSSSGKDTWVPSTVKPYSTSYSNMGSSSTGTNLSRFHSERNLLHSDSSGWDHTYTKPRDFSPSADKSTAPTPTNLSQCRSERNLGYERSPSDENLSRSSRRSQSSTDLRTSATRKTQQDDEKKWNPISLLKSVGSNLKTALKSGASIIYSPKNNLQSKRVSFFDNVSSKEPIHEKPNKNDASEVASVPNTPPSTIQSENHELSSSSKKRTRMPRSHRVLSRSASLPNDSKESDIQNQNQKVLSCKDDDLVTDARPFIAFSRLLSDPGVSTKSKNMAEGARPRPHRRALTDMAIKTFTELSSKADGDISGRTEKNKEQHHSKTDDDISESNLHRSKSDVFLNKPSTTKEVLRYTSRRSSSDCSFDNFYIDKLRWLHGIPPWRTDVKSYYRGKTYTHRQFARYG